MQIRRNLAAAMTGATIATMAFAATAFGASPTVVTDANAAEHGWTVQHANCVTTVSTGSQEMVEGPENPPLGTGSREFTTGVDGWTFETFRLDEFNGERIEDIETLTYSTYVTSNQGSQAAYINLLVDTDGDGVADDQLFWEPVYTSPVLLNEWQDWDAMNDGWWALSDGTFGPPTISLEQYAAEHPGATLAEPPTGLGSVRIAVGCGGAAWTSFIGNADAFTIGVDGEEFTYDFEVTNEPGNAEDCKDGGWMGLTDEDGEPFKNQGQCIKHVNGAGEGGGGE